MGPISLSTSIDASRERVFDFICDLAIRPSWTDHFTSDYRLERILASGQGAAARFRVDAPAGVRYMETMVAAGDSIACPSAPSGSWRADPPQT